MKKFLSVVLLLLISLTGTYAQNDQGLGYKTIDIGGELHWSPLQTTGGLHFAYNFPFHHGINLRLHVSKTDFSGKGANDSEKGNGYGLTLGYRYYFLLRPHGFFLGARHDLNRSETDWKKGLATGTSVTWTSQPMAEAGYMALINDQLFISPAIAAGYKMNIKTEGQPLYEGAVFYGGISVGYKF